MAQHDSSYKQLFSHPEMVEDLLTGFIHEDWVQQLDFSTLETVKSSFITADLREREDDIIWRVRWGEEWLYVYLLIEFQSSVNKFMVVRMMNYVSLLYQDLIKQNLLTAKGKLPPVFPIVLYNGEKRWQAAQNISELIEDIGGGMEKYCPSARYLLLDQGAILEKADLPDELHNLAAALFRLEHSRTETDLLAVLSNLVQWLNTPDKESVRRAFTSWMVRVLLPHHFPDVEAPQLQELYEVKDMLSERVKVWEQRWLEQGIEQGLEQGLEQGIEKGRRETQEALAINLMTNMDVDDAMIAKLTGLSVEAVRVLRTRQGH